jgi:hypothetical protein
MPSYSTPLPDLQSLRVPRVPTRPESLPPFASQHLPAQQCCNARVFHTQVFLRENKAKQTGKALLGPLLPCRTFPGNTSYQILDG